jgi:lysophospholipase L1-like esterase
MLDDKGMLRAELAADGLHPNADGYKIMVPLAEAAIARSLKNGGR